MNHLKLLVGVVFAVSGLLFAGPLAAQQTQPASPDDQTQPAADPHTPSSSDQVVPPPSQQEPAAATPSDDQTVTIPSDQPPVAAPEDIDEPYQEPAPLVDDDESDTLTPFGIGVTIGGAATGFTDGDFNDFVDTGAGWEGRITLGTRTALGFEAAYDGSVNDIDTFGVDDDANLLSNGVEGAFRLGLAHSAVQPYILAGAGWKHYSIENTNVNTSDLQDSDNVIEFPLGAGLNYKYNHFIADIRGTFRPTIDNELLRSEVSQDENELHTWRAGANIGFEF